MYVTKDKEFYKLMMRIAIPIGLQNLVTFAISMMDTLMIGTLGEVPLSAVSIANNLFFILMLLMFGLAGGSNIMIAQYWGRKDIEHIHRIMALMYRGCLLLSGVFMLIAFLFSNQIIGIFSEDPQVIQLGASYLRIVCMGYMFYAVANCTIMILRAVQTVKIAMWVYLGSLIVNVFFNWVFIFGNLGVPELGIQGAALATTISRLFEFTVIAIFIWKYDDKLNVTIKQLLKIDTKLLAVYFKTVSPVVLNELLWSLGTTGINYIIAILGTQVIAANSISNVILQLMTVFVFGVGNASATIIGNTIGQGKYEKTKEYAKTILIGSALLGVLAAFMTWVIAPVIINLYNVTDETKQIAYEITRVTAIILIFKSVAVNSMIGVLRGAGNTKFVLINDLIFMWVIALPVGYLATAKWGMSIGAIFFILRIDEVLKVFTSCFKILRGHWINDMTSAEN